MRVIGLTGGMGMGKSTAAAVFRRAGVPVFDADAEVRRLQGLRGAALPAIALAFPGVVRDGALDRAALRGCVLADPEALRRLEAILHPMVRAAERRFLARARRAGARAVVLDMPLLFESRRAAEMDDIIVVSAPAAVQRHRLRLRGRMSDSQIQAVLARQLPDAAKRRGADLVVRTGLSRYYSVMRLRRFIGEMVS